MELQTVIVIGNGVLLLIAIVILFFILNMGSRFDFAYGISAIQEPLKRRIRGLLLLFIFLALAAVLFNLIAGTLLSQLPDDITRPTTTRVPQ